MLVWFAFPSTYIFYGALSEQAVLPSIVSHVCSTDLSRVRSPPFWEYHKQKTVVSGTSACCRSSCGSQWENKHSVDCFVPLGALNGLVAFLISWWIHSFWNLCP